MQHRRCIAATLSAVLEPKEWNRNGPRHELAHFVVYYRDLVRMLAKPLPPLPVSTLGRENAEREIDDKGLGTALSSGLDGTGGGKDWMRRGMHGASTHVPIDHRVDFSLVRLGCVAWLDHSPR